MEADLMRRVLSQQDFVVWLGYFLPQIPIDGSADWLEPGVVLDASDGKLVHLDGVNLSRAWALDGIASALPQDDPRIPALMAASQIHRETGIAAVSDEHYSGSHWLASFATYLTTRRGIVDRGGRE
jgi:midasin (ATPase involved in ribosome maturation)